MRNWTNWRAHVEVFFTSRQRSLQSERMDPWEHEDRSSFGISRQLPSRPLRNRDHDQLFIWWWNLFLGNDRQWNKQIRDGNDGRNPREPHRWHRRQYRATCCWSRTEKTSMPQRDFRRTRSVRQELFRSVKEDDQIASTRSFSTSRRRRISRNQNLVTDVSFRIYVLLVMVNSNVSELFAKKDEVPGRDFSIVWIHTLLIPSCTFEHFKATLEENTLTLHCNTTCCYRATSPSTFTTLEAPTIWLNQSIRIGSGWQRRQERETCGVLYGREPNERDYDVTQPRIGVYKHNWKIHQNTVWCNLRVAQSKGLQFYQTRSNAIIHYNTLLAVCNRKGGDQQVRRRNCTAKRISLLLNRKELYLNLTCTYERQDTTSFDSRTSFDHSSKHKAGLVVVERATKIVAVK